MTIGECVKLHVADKCAEWKDASARIGILEKWAPEYKDQDATDLHEWSKQLVGYMRAKKTHDGKPKRSLADSSIRNVLAYLRAAIKYAFKVGKIAEDKTARMAMPTVSNERHHYPDRREMLRIAMKCRNRQVRAAIRIAFYSGMRKAEILRAKRTKKGFLLEDTKNGERRIIPIHPRIAVLARKIRFTIDEEKVSDQWDIARELAGYPETRFHDLRHGAASEMINSGVDLYTVGAVLGHMSPASTRRYSHLVTDKLAEAVGKIGGKKRK
ncbi:tyrosine-type recombinase/integrase [Herbaspirillum autotrophicum]|uniref:tyrosine-type recombinase/integrase n=1 Tax=Herbaspirillum autotrophicum TaxID=180195 RepID=UPI001E3637BB|nr:site-specific integrase [Herbaspirillum autotrophicum]